MFLLYLLVIVSVSFPSTNARVLLNEIMYAPTTDFGGSSNEWIELYAQNGNMTLQDCLFQDTELPEIIVDPYVVLVRRNDLFDGIYGNVSPVYEVSFGRGLANDGGNISLRCPSFEETVYYNDSMAKSNNFSLKKTSLVFLIFCTLECFL